MAAMSPSLYCVYMGNEQVPSQLIEKALKNNPLSSDSKTFLNAEVTEIKNVIGPSQGYSLTYRDRDSNQLAKAEFDYVVLAAPLHQDSKLIGPENVKLPSIKYQSVDRSFFHGTLKSGAFGINTDSLSNGDSLFLLPSKSYYENHDDPKDMPNPLETLPKLFLNLLDNDRIDENKKSSKLVQWLAYPVYSPMTNPSEELGNFILAPHLYYSNTIELLASCMELAVIGGRNVALLIGADRIQSGHGDKLHFGTNKEKPLYGALTDLFVKSRTDVIVVDS